MTPGAVSKSPAADPGHITTVPHLHDDDDRGISSPDRVTV